MPMSRKLAALSLGLAALVIPFQILIFAARQGPSPKTISLDLEGVRALTYGAGQISSFDLREILLLGMVPALGLILLTITWLAQSRAMLILSWTLAGLGVFFSILGALTVGRYLFFPVITYATAVGLMQASFTEAIREQAPRGGGVDGSTPPP